MKELILLGASGSIGVQSLDVIRNYPNDFKLNAFSVGNNTQNVASLINEFKPQAVYMLNAKKAEKFQQEFKDVTFFSNDNLDKLINFTNADLLVNAIVGIAGLKPTWAAINKQMNIALANKETLVAGGDLIMNLAKSKNVTIYPIDSEHSAIWQCLLGSDKKAIKSITLTASGGSFRDLNRTQLTNVTKKDALNHPNWSMGSKITIDSATMMNKGLEIIEAHYLFDIDYDQINVILHKQSIVHSYVEFIDYSIIAQLGKADMRQPIQFALTYPKHLKLHGGSSLDLKKVASLTFEEVDLDRFPLVKLAYQVGRAKGNKPIVMNAANEVAVNLFLNDKISFIDIETIVIKTVAKYKLEKVLTINKVLQINKEVKEDVLNNYLSIIS